jgi:hypothetical protein
MTHPNQHPTSILASFFDGGKASAEELGNEQLERPRQVAIDVVRSLED